MSVEVAQYRAEEEELSHQRASEIVKVGREKARVQEEAMRRAVQVELAQLRVDEEVAAVSGCCSRCSRCSGCSRMLLEAMPRAFTVVCTTGSLTDREKTKTRMLSAGEARARDREQSS
jgi:hypothetical protein